MLLKPPQKPSWPQPLEETNSLDVFESIDKSICISQNGHIFVIIILVEVVVVVLIVSCFSFIYPMGASEQAQAIHLRFRFRIFSIAQHLWVLSVPHDTQRYHRRGTQSGEILVTEDWVQTQVRSDRRLIRLATRGWVSLAVASSTLQQELPRNVEYILLLFVTEEAICTECFQIC